MPLGLGKFICNWYFSGRKITGIFMRIFSNFLELSYNMDLGGLLFIVFIE